MSKGFGMGGNMNQLMKQAQQMQNKLMKVQEEASLKTVEAAAGGGMVSVVVNGKQELLGIKIEKEVVNPEDVEMLQDLILAAVNDGLRKSQAMVAEEMQKVTGGVNIPGLF